MDSLRTLQVALCACAVMAAAATVAVIAFQEEEDDEDDLDVPSLNERVNVTAAKLSVLRTIRRRLDLGENPAPKRPKKMYNWDRARAAMQEDCLGPNPQFVEAQFARIFRVTRGIAERLIQVCGLSDDFFTGRKTLFGEDAIAPEAKILMALKCIGCGVSCSAFVDYFQMGITTGRESVKRFAKCMSGSEELRGKYLRSMSKADARRLSQLHEEEHGIPGCVGMLDCMHVYWRTCPMAWKGQCQGKEGCPSMVMEGVSDYNLWLWHSRAGTPGSNNDINAWDQSSLLRAILTGKFDELDFEFTIGGETFNQLWFYVDGIYPELSRFVKTISVPLSEEEEDYTAWQESSRKDIERTFGVLQRKFMILAKPAELWFADEILELIDCCVILHNMMAEDRIRNLLQEDETMYDTNITEAEVESMRRNRRRSSNRNNEDDDDVDTVRHNIPANETARQRRNNIPAVWTSTNNPRVDAIRNSVQFRQEFEEAQSQWDALYNPDEHCRLRTAIVEELHLIKTASDQMIKLNFTVHPLI